MQVLYFSRQNLEIFDILHAFSTIKCRKVSAPETVRFFGPPCMYVLDDTVLWHNYTVVPPVR